MCFMTEKAHFGYLNQQRVLFPPAALFTAPKAARAFSPSMRMPRCPHQAQDAVGLQPDCTIAQIDLTRQAPPFMPVIGTASPNGWWDLDGCPLQDLPSSTPTLPPRHFKNSRDLSRIT